MPNVNSEILTWARETAGLSLEEAARRLNLNPDRLAAMEAGGADPSRRQLALMSEKYRRPLLTFYLPRLPREREKGQDFRTLPEGFAPESEALLDVLLRDVQARQSLIKSALEEAEEAEPLPFVGSARMRDGIDAMVASMRNVLNVDIQHFRNCRNVTEAFALLRSAAEQAGIFVLLMGNLGTHHTDIDARVFRGFALADRVAPFVIINEKDSRAAWSFTLLHELAHIWLGQTGISGYNGEVEVEKFCDAVAARFLLNPAELTQIDVRGARDPRHLKEMIDGFSRERNLSRKMVAYNLLRSGIIARAVYADLVEQLDAERLAQQADRPQGEGGPNYYVVRRHRIGGALIRLVERMIASGMLSNTKASKVLGVKPTSVQRLVSSNAA